jgi:hexosaminidase
MNFNGSEAVYEYFVDRAATIARSQARTPVQWVEVYEHFTNKLSNDTVVHVWKEKETMTKVIMDGYRTILSDQDVWYLDHLDVSWESFYLNEPTAELPDDANANLILGGEACMWGETVDPSDVDATIFPRAAAFAERMWTSQSVILPESTFWLPNNHDAIEDRLEQFRCLLQERAIGAAPVRNQKAREAPPKPGSCFVQRRK